MPVGDAGERGHQGREVLAGLEGSHEDQVRPAAGQPVVQGGQAGFIGSRLRLVGTEAAGVDPVGSHEQLGLDRAPPDQLLGGDPARAHHRRGPAGGHLDRPPEEEDLRPLVPVRLFEEAQVVHGDHDRHRRSLGHRVVGTVVDRHGLVGQQPGEPDLFPGQPAEPGVGCGRYQVATPGPPNASGRRRTVRLNSTTSRSDRSARAPASCRV